MIEDSLKDVLDWGRANGECPGALCELEQLPSQLGIANTDLTQCPAGMIFALQKTSSIIHREAPDPAPPGGNEGKAICRSHMLVRRYFARAGEPISRKEVQGAWKDLVQLIKKHEGKAKCKHWKQWQHRVLTPLVARARKTPWAIDQAEIERISADVNPTERRVLRRSVRFLNSLSDVEGIPDLERFAPMVELVVPAGSARARRMNWNSFPAAFRASFDEAARRAVEMEDDLGQAAIERIEAGEDPEVVTAEVEAAAGERGHAVRNPERAIERYRYRVNWLVRAWEDRGGDVTTLTSVDEVMTSSTIEGAIADHIARSSMEASDLKDPARSTTLKGMLRPLASFARYGLRMPGPAAVIALLHDKHVVRPRAKLGLNADQGGAIADEVARKLRRAPAMAVAYTNGPERVAREARRRIVAARQKGSKAGEMAALNLFQGAVMLAIQMSRPLRPEVLWNMRIRAEGSAASNQTPTVTTATIRFEMEAWEGKTQPVAVTLRGSDARIVHHWIKWRRGRWLELRGIADTCYLFPGEAQPSRRCPDGSLLPRGTRSPHRLTHAWRSSCAMLGQSITPHQCRHLVAMLILAERPGDYAFVASVLGNSEDIARAHYGRDTGEKAAMASREAILAAHPEALDEIRRRARR
jgi:hypothetical protein